ncbi:hypothetical protein M407DRAFT_216046, partial [Tulasnella calospora MUT 4182]
NPLASAGSDSPVPEQVDVCIIGSGLTGVSCAYHLAQLVESGAIGSMKLVILEARDFCEHLLSLVRRNGGQLVVGRFSKMHGLTMQYGAEEAIKSTAIEEYTVSEIRKIIRENGWEGDVDLVECRRVNLVFNPRDLGGIESDIAAARRAKVSGIDNVEVLTVEQAEKEYGAKYPGYRQPGNNLWPLKLVTKLFQHAQDPAASRNSTRSFPPAGFSSATSSSMDLALYTHTTVMSVIPSWIGDSNRAYDVQTTKGIIHADYVVHATNVYVSHLLPQFSEPENAVVPVRGQVIGTRASVPRGELWSDNFVGNAGFEYWFPRPCPSSERPLIILGGGRESAPWEYNVTDDSILDETVGKTLRGFLPAVYPNSFSKDTEPEFEWTGIMGFTPTKDPYVGLVSSSSARPSGEYVSVGYNGRGMARAFACAEAIAQMIVAKQNGKTWERPPWLPIWYLTEQTRTGL